MKNTKMHKIDFIFIIALIVIGIIGGMIDGFYWLTYKGDGGFPVYSCMSIFITYALWIILLIYSFLKYKEKTNKPEYVRWFMYFLIPFIQMPFIILGWLISALFLKILNLL